MTPIVGHACFVFRNTVLVGIASVAIAVASIAGTSTDGGVPVVDIKKETAYAYDDPLPKDLYLSTGLGDHDIVTYRQNRYILSEPLPDELVGQLALEAGPRATREQINAILDVAINRGSGILALIAKDMGTAAWWSRESTGTAGRIDIFNDPGYANTVNSLKKEMFSRVDSKQETRTDHTLFRHTSSASTALPCLFVMFPQALTSTNEYASEAGYNLVTYRNETWRHIHPVATTAVASNK